MNIRKRTFLTFCTLLFFPGLALADDYTYYLEHNKTKNDDKILQQLDALGINDPDIKDFVMTIKGHAEKNSIDFYKGDVPTGKINFRWQLRTQALPGTSTKPDHLQLVYTPDFDSHVNAVASKNGIFITYKLKFP